MQQGRQCAFCKNSNIVKTFILGWFLPDSSSGPMSNDKLQTLVKSWLDELFEIGLNVNVLICDQGSNNRSFVETMENDSVSKPFFVHTDHKLGSECSF